MAHSIHADHTHTVWDHSIEPVLEIASGDTVELEVTDASGGQLTAASTVADIAALDFGRINPVTGPVYIDGAQPGDAVKITLDSFGPSGFGWTANIPGFGLLADPDSAPGVDRLAGHLEAAVAELSAAASEAVPPLASPGDGDQLAGDDRPRFARARERRAARRG